MCFDKLEQKFLYQFMLLHVSVISVNNNNNKIFRFHTLSWYWSTKEAIDIYLGHRRTMSRGINLPNFVPEECLQWKVRSVVITVSEIDCLIRKLQHYKTLKI